MTIRNYLKQKWQESFVEPAVFAAVAKMLRSGIPIVKVRYRSHPEPRYYTGTGLPYGNGSGKRARWMMEVTHFEELHDGISELAPKILPWMDATELDLLVKWDNSHVYMIEAVFVSAVTHDDQLDIIKDIVRRLKPGQGYNYSGSEIKQDFIQPDGYLVHTGNTKRLVSEEYLNTGVVFPRDAFGSDFKVKNLFIADEKKIKRQHRPNTDLKRWTVLTHLVSNEEPWVIKYTHDNTAGAPVHYYGLTIDIDSKLMKGHPFYITELVDSAANEVFAKHGAGNYTLNTDRIFIQWEGHSDRLPNWLEHAKKFEGFVDAAPVIVYKKLESRIARRYNGKLEVTEA